MGTSGAEEVQLHAFLTSAVEGVGWLPSHTGSFILEEVHPVTMKKGALGGCHIWPGRSSVYWESNPDASVV